jgi:hypothetical protein
MHPGDSLKHILFRLPPNPTLCPRPCLCLRPDHPLHPRPPHPPRPFNSTLSPLHKPRSTGSNHPSLHPPPPSPPQTIPPELSAAATAAFLVTQAHATRQAASARTAAFATASRSLRTLSATPPGRDESRDASLDMSHVSLSRDASPAPPRARWLLEL